MGAAPEPFQPGPTAPRLALPTGGLRAGPEGSADHDAPFPGRTPGAVLPVVGPRHGGLFRHGGRHAPQPPDVALARAGLHPTEAGTAARRAGIRGPRPRVLPSRRTPLRTEPLQPGVPQETGAVQPGARRAAPTQAGPARSPPNVGDARQFAGEDRHQDRLGAAQPLQHACDPRDLHARHPADAERRRRASRSEDLRTRPDLISRARWVPNQAADRGLRSPASTAP